MSCVWQNGDVRAQPKKQKVSIGILIKTGTFMFNRQSIKIAILQYRSSTNIIMNKVLSIFYGNHASLTNSIQFNFIHFILNKF